MSAPRPPKAPLVALGLLTLATFLGPLAILLTFLGGPRPGWPPDRPVEWVVLVGVVTAFVVLLLACLTCGLWARPRRPSDGRQ
jgi:hypothetical protein